MNNGKPETTDTVVKQDQELLASITRLMPLDLIPNDYKQELIGSPVKLRTVLTKAFVPAISVVVGKDEAAIKDWWVKFYQKYFNLKVDLSAVKIPDYQEGFDWVIIIAQSLTISQVLKALKRYMKVYLYKDNLSDKDVPTNDRDAKNGSYAVRFRKRVEADEELKNYSANDLKENNVVGITLLERLIMELAYFEETDGKHLDINNWTLCSGSRYSGGDVPHVDWGPGYDELYVGWSFLGDAVGYLRARAAVSC